jgi:hypothetical protein
MGIVLILLVWLFLEKVKSLMNLHFLSFNRKRKKTEAKERKAIWNDTAPRNSAFRVCRLRTLTRCAQTGACMLLFAVSVSVRHDPSETTFPNLPYRQYALTLSKVIY